MPLARFSCALGWGGRGGGYQVFAPGWLGNQDDACFSTVRWLATAALPSYDCQDISVVSQMIK